MRWTSGSLEELLMVSASGAPVTMGAAGARSWADHALDAWANGAGGAFEVEPEEEEIPPTERSDGSGPVGAPKVATFLDELAGDALDLGLRLLVVDSIATILDEEEGGLSSVEDRTFFAHAAGLIALREALDAVCARAADPRVSRVVAPDAPLGAYVKGLYLRASAVARALELFGFRSLDEAADAAAFARTVANAATFHFPDLRDSIRRELATLRLELGQTSIVRGLRDAVEQLFLASAELDRAREVAGISAASRAFAMQLR